MYNTKMERDQQVKLKNQKHYTVCVCVCVLLFSHSAVLDSLQPHGLQHTKSLWPHHLSKFAQVHIHCISDAVKPSHPLTPFSPSALNLSQHQGLFQ